MKSIQLTPEIAAVAKRVLWFEPPEQAIAEPFRFVAYAMTYGDHADMTSIRKQLSDRDLLIAISHAPPGVFDARSWAYWNLLLGRFPAPPMPERSTITDGTDPRG
jgi:hypothetical protein